jgi:hypothetical protein
MWVPKGSTPIKIELITRTSTVRPTLKSKRHMTSKVLLSKHTNKKADPWSHDWTWSSRRQPQGQKIISGHLDHWRSHNQFPSFNTPMYGQGIHIQVCLVVHHGFGIVLGCQIMNPYNIVGLFQNRMCLISTAVICETLLLNMIIRGRPKKLQVIEQH